MSTDKDLRATIVVHVISLMPYEIHSLIIEARLLIRDTDTQDKLSLSEPGATFVQETYAGKVFNYLYCLMNTGQSCSECR